MFLESPVACTPPYSRWSRVERCSRAACSAEQGSPGSQDPPLDENGQCFSNGRFFAERVWARVMQKTCVNCHSPDGIAVNKGADFILLPATYPGFLEANLATLETLARTEYDDQSILLRKPLGELEHGGGKQIVEGSEEYEILSDLVARLQAGDPCSDAVATGSFADVTLLGAGATLRKASLHLLGRLPTADELAVVTTGGEAALPAALEALMRDDAFFTRLKEIYNDDLLTDRYMGYNGYAINLLNEEYWPKVKDDVYDTLTDEDRAKINRAVAREPLELISYVVKNDRPFTEIVTAPYTVVNPFSAGIYNTDAVVPGRRQRERVGRGANLVRQRKRRIFRVSGGWPPHLADVLEPLPHHADEPQSSPRAHGVQAVLGYRHPSDRRAAPRSHRVHSIREPHARRSELLVVPQAGRPGRRRVPEVQRLRPGALRAASASGTPRCSRPGSARRR